MAAHEIVKFPFITLQMQLFLVVHNIFTKPYQYPRNGNFASFNTGVTQRFSLKCTFFVIICEKRVLCIINKSTNQGHFNLFTTTRRYCSLLAAAGILTLGALAPYVWGDVSCCQLHKDYSQPNFNSLNNIDKENNSPSKILPTNKERLVLIIYQQ